MMRKVVLTPAGGGDTSLRIDPLSTSTSRKAPPGSELHLGSQDLIRLANYASGRGFTVASFMLADAHLVPLDREEEAEISDQLVDALRAYGEEEIEAALQQEHNGLYVVGVTLIAASGLRVNIRRRGYVETSVVQEAESLLMSAWRELQLS